MNGLETSVRRAVRFSIAVGVVTFLIVSCTRGADQEQEGGPLPDWVDPLVNGVNVSGVDEAVSLLGFEPRLPAELGNPVRLLITDPESAGMASRDFAAVYDHSTYGRFWIIERVSEMSKAELRSWAECDPAAGCEGTWTLVTVGEGIEGILIEGPIATSVVWLVNDVRFDVVGPADTFVGKEALNVANLVEASTPTGRES